MFRWLSQSSNPLQNLHGVQTPVPIDANFDGLSTAVVSHAFSSFESMHNSMTSSSLRSSTIHSGLSDSSIFSSTSVLLCTKAVQGLFPRIKQNAHPFGRCICCIPRQRLQLSMSFLCAGTSTYASRCCYFFLRCQFFDIFTLFFSDLGFL